ncbi:hypothetical protein PC111_g22120 [Phytophthora cactorum]|nr:hypothetical protein PC111_g22120 [Phytophthora cactorum]KAG2795869.1 hypothetical protein PC112_g22451 [Phytophthora cactorum]
MNPAPASSAPSEAPPALPAATEVSAEPPAAPPVPGDASAPVTEASLQAMLSEISEASFQLHVSPPLHTDVAAQRRLNSAVGFDDVLAAVQPLPDSLPDLPRQIGELEARLRSAEADAAAAKRSVVPQMLARESAEQLLKISSSKVESRDAENRRLRATNIRVDALLQKMKESTDLHTQDLELARAEVAERDAVIQEREAFKAAVAANTEQTRQLHAMLIKAQKGKFVDADTAHSLEDLQKRNTHLLHINRVLRSHVSLAGMDPEMLVLAVQGMTAGELNLADLELDQETFVALQRIQAEAAGSSDPHAVPAALARAAHQVAHGKLHKRIRPGGQDTDNDLGVDPDSSSEDKPPIPTDQASSAMSAAGLGDDATVESSSSKPGSQSSVRSRSSQSSRRTSPRSQSRSRSPSPTTSPTGRPRSRSQSASSKRATPVSSPPSSIQASPSASKVLKDDRPPELIDLTSDVEMSSSSEDSSSATSRAEKGTRDPVPSPTGGKTVPGAPAPLAEASSVTKEIPDSGPPSSPHPKAAPSAVPGDEDEGIIFHDLIALFGSDGDDGDQPRSAQTSSLSATHRPSGVTSPYRSSSDEDDSADDEGPRDTSIAKRPSLPASPSSTPMEVDDNGGRTRKDAGGDSRRDEPSFDFSSGDTAGEEAVPAPTEGSSSAGGAGDASSSARSDVPGGEGPPADTGRPGADEGTPPVSRSPTPLRRTPSPPTSPQRRLPPPGSARSRSSSLPQEAGPGRMIVATYTSRLRYGDPSPAQPLPMSHLVVQGPRPAILPSASFPPWVQPYLDMSFTAPGAKSCFERVLSRVLPEPTPGHFELSVTGQRSTRTLGDVGDDFRACDTTRKEAPFYLVHGWDAQTTLRAMTSSLKRGSGRQSDALAWRRDVNRQHKIALTMAKDYQAAERQ